MINPNLNTDLKNVLAQGHNVGDIDTDSSGVKWRWNGNNWDREPNHMQDPQHQVASTTSPDDFINKIKAELQAQMDEFNKRATDFNTNSPFAFDELQARQSAEERFNPYYEAELGDFLSGIKRQRESAESEKTLLTELNTIKVGADKRDLEEAIKASEEGYAGAGLFFSGARERTTGLQEIEGKERATQNEKQFGYNLGNINRNLEGIAQNEATGKRTTQAAKETDIQTEIEKMKGEERARWETEKQQYIGYPYVTSQTGGLNEFLGYTFNA